MGYTINKESLINRLDLLLRSNDKISVDDCIELSELKLILKFLRDNLNELDQFLEREI